MTEEVMTQLAHYEMACQIWDEAHRLYAGTTMMDWMLTIASLINTKHKDGEDIAANIAKMKGYHRNIILMNSFAALPDHYASAEAKHRICEEHGIHLSQTKGSNTSYQASHNCGSLDP
ncbi:hypothetical protein PAXRUDRAFT_35976 [Paxillus rubicundulus Ve08.2h10]|uniref:Uncharacterized protein n=1 Tax=Paxillus rubicundulus Ve08.2h10 TaxID=930991 RepID=A0A0D0CEH0_9AGAM|nr:hypothetical protein PAXRUDRAFT_35976 [Paxillus rubicundulus Ve08.2h10]